ncbi:MAG: OmpA family protein, partial [Rhodovulum sp.]|nr:OmpA family protein [Rhodovulum sp.]
FAAKLGENENYAINVEFVELEEIPEDESLTPEQCVARINDVQSITKITFGPGVTSVEGDSLNVVDKIAEILRECPDAQIEVGGHTDNQGSEGGNQSLSQQRANAVVNALAARRILVSNLTAVGYGETTPIADNSTEEGREANRRIEFRLMETVEAEPDIPENTEGAEPSDAPADEQGSGDAEPTTDDTQTDAAE